MRGCNQKTIGKIYVVKPEGAVIITGSRLLVLAT